PAAVARGVQKTTAVVALVVTAETFVLLATIVGGSHDDMDDAVAPGTIAYAASAFTGAMPWSSHSVRNVCVRGVVSVEPPSAAQVPVRGAAVTLSVAVWG